MLPVKLAFVDIETTGARFSYDRIIEIGIVRVENNKIVKTYNQLINPEIYLPPEIIMLTGITMQDLRDKPTFQDVKDEIIELLDDCVFVAHNVRFDYGFLKSEFVRERINFSQKQCCTVKLSRCLFPSERHHNLTAVVERLSLRCEQRHRAYNDAHLLYQFYQKIQHLFPTETIEQAIKIAMNKPSLPSLLKQKDIDDLPEQPGVYIFYSEDNTPLYIGKSKNIRKRVLSHFSSDIRISTDMKITQQIKHISTIPTAGELGALFTEAKMIKEMLPLYNKKLRQQNELIALVKSIDKHGYPIVAMETLISIDPKRLTDFLGFFRSRRQAKAYLSRMVKEYQLCDKLLGLEKTATTCFSYRLGICKGACNQKESIMQYMIRFLTAFAGIKVKPWPFNGPIAIEEENPVTLTKEYFLVDKWCCIGRVNVDSSGAFNEVIQNMTFDLDTYKILRGFFRNQQNARRIKLLSELHIQEASTKNHPTP